MKKQRGLPTPKALNLHQTCKKSAVGITAYQPSYSYVVVEF